MSLVTCPECKSQVSSTARACPHCGLRKPPRWWLIILRATIALIALAAWWIQIQQKRNLAYVPGFAEAIQRVNAEHVDKLKERHVRDLADAKARNNNAEGIDDLLKRQASEIAAEIQKGKDSMSELQADEQRAHEIATYVLWFAIGATAIFFVSFLWR